MRSLFVFLVLTVLAARTNAADIGSPVPMPGSGVVPHPVVPSPTDPSKPAPAGQQWQKVGNGPWQLVPAPEVRARPFQQVSRTTPGISALPADDHSMSLAGSTATGHTTILALPAGRRGSTNCSPVG